MWKAFIEVRDSWMGYFNFIPVRCGLGVWSDWRVVGKPSPPSPSPGNSGWHSGRGTIFGVFKLEFDSYERYHNFDTGVLHILSSRIYLAEWFGLGSHFGRTMHMWALFQTQKACFVKMLQKWFRPQRFPGVYLSKGSGGWSPPANLIFNVNFVIRFKLEIDLIPTPTKWF